MSTHSYCDRAQDNIDGNSGSSTRRTVSFSPGSQSPDEDGESAVKKRKVSRACDTCRKRKVRCDFVQLPSGDLQKCLNCFSAKIECTLTQANKPRRSSKDHVKSLEEKLQRTEKLLELLCPDPRVREELLEGDSDEIPPGAITPIRLPVRPPPDLSMENLDLVDIEALAKATGRNPEDLTDLAARLQIYNRHPSDEGELQNDERDDDEEEIAEADHLAKIAEAQLNIKEEEEVAKEPGKPFFYGKSSARAMLDQVIKVKLGSRTPLPPSPDTEGDQDSDAANIPCLRLTPSDSGSAHGGMSPAANSESSAPQEPRFHPARWRPANWQIHPWEKGAFRSYELKRNTTIQYDFPDSALLKALMDNYFKYINLELPLLHRPTLERQISKGFHRRDSGFRSTVLLVCALGARYSADPRVQVSEEERQFMEELQDDEGVADPSSGSSKAPSRDTASLYHAKGWKYFDQAWKLMDNHLFWLPPTLYDLQFYCLATEYLQGTSLPQASWVMIGIGIRLGQDVGAHRRSDFVRSDPEVARQDELRKRAFWVLVTLDRQLSSATGRPCTMHDECIDTELPLECDDEYWNTPDSSMALKQPEGKPSKVTAFNVTIRLNQILLACLRTLYSIRRAKTIGGVARTEWEEKIVSEMDSALNKWLCDVPPHLRWNLQQPNDDFFMQSAILHASFYNIQILVHRPFMPSPRNPTPAANSPSVAICTNAARSLIRIGVAQVERLGEVSITMPLQLLTASVVLLLKVWEDRRKGRLTEQAFRADMEDLNLCLKILAAAEKRWYSAGKLRDLLQSLLPENSQVDTVAAELPKGVHQEMDTQPSPYASSDQSSSLFSPSPFSTAALSPVVDPSQSNPSPSTHVDVPMDSSSYGLQAVPSEDSDAQWATFTSGPSTDLQTPQQFMFSDMLVGGNIWEGQGSDSYQSPSESQHPGGSQQSPGTFFSSWDHGALNESSIASAALDPDLYMFGGTDSLPPGDFDFLQAGSFSQVLSPFWPGTTMDDPGNAAPGPSDASGINMPANTPFDNWQYLTGLVDLTGRNDLVDHLFPNPPQPGYGPT